MIRKKEGRREEGVWLGKEASEGNIIYFSCLPYGIMHERFSTALTPTASSLLL
jgi:hypothetical protein